MKKNKTRQNKSQRSSTILGATTMRTERNVNMQIERIINAELPARGKKALRRNRSFPAAMDCGMGRRGGKKAVSRQRCLSKGRSGGL